MCGCVCVCVCVRMCVVCAHVCVHVCNEAVTIMKIVAKLGHNAIEGHSMHGHFTWA